MQVVLLGRENSVDMGFVVVRAVVVEICGLHDFTKTDTGLPTRPEAARDRRKRPVINPSPPIVVWMVQTGTPGLVTGLQAL